MSNLLKSPFPYFGGKSKAAPAVWRRFGDVKNYVEPFYGSGAMLLQRPGVDYDNLPKETVNDKDGFISNFWRAVIHAPNEVAKWADWPPNENDMHSRHAWLVKQREGLTQRLEGDPDYYDAKVAGWWVWGIALWIGSGWCSGKGPYQAIDGKLLHVGNAGRGINRKLLHVGNAGRGINRQRLHVGDAGQGINRQRLHVGNAGQGQGVIVIDQLTDYMKALQARLRKVRVCSGDWSRIMGPSVTTKHGLTAVFLDPPYNNEANRTDDLYAEDCLNVSHDVREWALGNGDDPLLRIALCGYEHEHGQYMPDAWECVEWKTGGGYDGQRKNGINDNRKTERIWFSPHCLKIEKWNQVSLI